MHCVIIRACILSLVVLAYLSQATSESPDSTSPSPDTQSETKDSIHETTAESKEGKDNQEEKSKEKKEEGKREPLLETDEDLIKKLASLENEAEVEAYIKKHPEEIEGIDENRLKEKAASYRQLQQLLPRMQQYVEEPPLDL